MLRGAVSLAFLLAADGARINKKKRGAGSNMAHTKFVAGVPVMNYQMAYGGNPSFEELEETREEEFIVMMKDGTTDAQLGAMCSVAKNGCRLTGHPDKGGFAFLEMRGTEKDLETVINSANGAVKMIEVDQTLQMIPELEAEVASGGSWGIDRVGSGRGRNGNNGEGVHIFILDTGVRSTHQEFGGRAAPLIDYSPMLGLAPKECDQGDLECAADNQGHGTHCAGTAAGATYGVATKAKVWGVKVLGDSGAGSLFGIIGSVDYLASTTQRPAVGSMSLGGTCPFGFCGLYFAMGWAVEKAVDSGVTVVVAGGNSNADSCGFMPAYVPAAITVGSTDSEDKRSHFSNYGSCTNIWAPGSKITSATHEDDSGAKTYSGTSMACPHVAGGAAVLLQQNPGLLSPALLENLHSLAATGYISDLKDDDQNKLLYLAADAPPPKGPISSLVETTRASCSGGDQSRLKSMGGSSRSGSVPHHMASCGRSTLSWTFQWQADQFISCASNAGISKNCARCYEGSGRYGYSNCKTACLAGWCTAGCLSCVAPSHGTLNRCTGFVPTEQPSAC